MTSRQMILRGPDVAALLEAQADRSAARSAACGLSAAATKGRAHGILRAGSPWLAAVALTSHDVHTRPLLNRCDPAAGLTGDAS